MSSADNKRNEELLKTCWFCNKRPADNTSTAGTYLFRRGHFLDYYGSHIIQLAQTYEPNSLEKVIEAVEKSQNANALTQFDSMRAIELIFAKNPTAHKILEELKVKDYAEYLGRIRYRTIIFGVPRCPTCLQLHNRVQTFAKPLTVILMIITGLAGLGAVGAGLALKFSVDGDMGAILVLAVVFGCLALVCVGLLDNLKKLLTRLFSSDTKPQDYKNKFPMVLDKLELGWELGSKPNEKN